MAGVNDQGFDAGRLERVANGIRSDIDDERCHGVALRVARGGKVVLDVTEGWSDKAADRKLGKDAVFISMSVAKQFTAVLALSLVERGVLRLHTPVAELIPEFGALGKQNVNLYHLLTHTGGLQSSIPVLPPEVLSNIGKMVVHACGLPLESLPGERVNYSPMVAYDVIAALCLRAAGNGRSFAEMMRQEIFQPLAMASTSFGPREDLFERLCPVRPAFSGPAAFMAPESIEGMAAQMTVAGCENPAANYWTTVGDLHRFAEMLCRGGELDGVRVLSPAMINFCTRNHTGAMRNVIFDPFAPYRHWDYYPANLGVGFFVRGEGVTPGPFGVLNSPNAFGGVGLGSTAFIVDPARDLTLAFLSAGLMEETYHFERVGRIADQVISAMVH